MELWPVPPVAFLASLVQSVTGFGSGIIPMAILPAWLDIRTVAPLVALVTATVDVGMLVRYRAAVRAQAILPLAAGMVVGIPAGILFVRRVDERLVLGVLGAVVALYALYSLARSVGLGAGGEAARPQPPAADAPPPCRGAWRRALAALLPAATGLVAGLLGGAYNTSGPPLILYGDARGWEPAEFRGNLQSLFLLNDALVITGHLVAGNVTPVVLYGYLLALPGLGLGFLLGGRLARRLPPERFRLLVQVLLLVLGVRLLLS